jgi:hypothetical protein
VVGAAAAALALGGIITVPPTLAAVSPPTICCVFASVEMPGRSPGGVESRAPIASDTSGGKITWSTGGNISLIPYVAISVMCLQGSACSGNDLIGYDHLLFAITPIDCTKNANSCLNGCQNGITGTVNRAQATNPAAPLAGSPLAANWPGSFLLCGSAGVQTTTGTVRLNNFNYGITVPSTANPGTYQSTLTVGYNHT